MLPITHSATANKRTGGKPSRGVDRPWLEETLLKTMPHGVGAEISDRIERERWVGRKFRSPYAHLVAIPAIVRAGDTATAKSVLYRIEAVMEKGGWTRNEWARIHKLRQAWEKRAAGQDVGFMLRGWKRKGDGQHTPGIEKFITTIKGVVGKNGKASK